MSQWKYNDAWTKGMMGHRTCSPAAANAAGSRVEDKASTLPAAMKGISLYSSWETCSEYEDCTAASTAAAAALASRADGGISLRRNSLGRNPIRTRRFDPHKDYTNRSERESFAGTSSNSSSVDDDTGELDTDVNVNEGYHHRRRTRHQSIRVHSCGNVDEDGCSISNDGGARHGQQTSNSDNGTAHSFA